MKSAALAVCVSVLLQLVAPVVRGADEPPGSVERVLRAHDVRFLTRSVPQFPVSQWPIAGDWRAAIWPHEDTPHDAGFFTAGFEGDAITPGTGISSYALIDLIKSNVAEDTWANERNSIDAREGELVVVQTPDVQARIEELLAALRARRARMVTVEVALVPAAALGEIDRDAASLPAAAFDEILARAGEGGRLLSLTAYNDQTVSAFDGRRLRAVTEESLNSTGVLPVVNPWVSAVPLGLTVEVRPRVIDGTDWLTLDLELVRIELAGEIERRETFFTEIELVPRREERVKARLLLERDGAALAAVLDERGDPDGARDFAILVRARPVDVEGDRAPGADPDDVHHLHAYDVGFLLDRAPGRDEADLDPRTFLDLVRTNVDPDAWRDGRADLDLDERLLLVTARPSTHGEVRAWIDERIRERGRVVTVEVTELEGPLDAVLAVTATAGVDAALPEGWHDGARARGLRRVFHGASRGVLGSPLEAAGYSARPFVRELEFLSGGTGQLLRSMPESNVASAGTGFALEAEVRETLDEERFVLDLELQRFRTDFGHRVSFLAAHSFSGDRQWREYALDLPAHERRPVRMKTSVPAGRDVVLEARETAAGEGRLVVARVAVRGEGRTAERPRDGTPARRMRLYPLDLIGPEADPLPEPFPPGPALREHFRYWQYQRDFRRTESFEEPPDRGYEVADLVQEFIDPDSWSNRRNSLDVSRGRLAAVQAPAVLERVGRFLTRLERHAGRTLLVELALAPPETLDSVAPEWNRPGTPPWLAGDVLDAAVRAAGARGRHLAVRARAGEPVRAVPATVSRRLADHDVDQTGVVPGVLPVAIASGEGPFAEVRVLLAPSRSWMRADVVLGETAAPRELIETRRLPWGEVELPREFAARLETTTAGPLGSTLVIGSVSLPAEDAGGGGEGNRDAAAEASATPPRFVALLRVRPLIAVASGEDRRAVEQPAILDCAALVEPVRRELSSMPRGWDEDHLSFFVFAPRGEDDDGVSPLIDHDVLEAALLEAAGSDPDAVLRFTDSGRTALLRGDGDAVGRARTALAEAAERVRPVTIDLWQGSVDGRALAALGGRGAVLGEEWLERFDDRGGARVRLTGLGGAVIALGSVASRSFVGRVERVSGGTGEHIVEVSDPTIDTLGEGIVLQAVASPVPGTPWVELRVQGELAAPPVFDRQVRVPEDPRVQPLPDGAEEWVTIDLPAERSERWEHLVTAPLGRPVLLNALPDPAAPGRTLALIAVVNAPPLER